MDHGHRGAQHGLFFLFFFGYIDRRLARSCQSTQKTKEKKGKTEKEKIKNKEIMFKIILI